jgi:hypothetical protein
MSPYLWVRKYRKQEQRIGSLNYHTGPDPAALVTIKVEPELAHEKAEGMS